MPSPTPRDLSSAFDAARQPPLRAHWLAELIRLREAHWGPLEDASALRQVRQLNADLPARILARAQLLAQRENLIPLVDGWRRSALAVLAACCDPCWRSLPASQWVSVGGVPRGTGRA